MPLIKESRSGPLLLVRRPGYVLIELLAVVAIAGLPDGLGFPLVNMRAPGPEE
jgi:hypothetical protein